MKILNVLFIVVVCLSSMLTKAEDKDRFIESEITNSESGVIDIVVTDSVTGLTWQKTYTSDAIQWIAGLKYCEDSSYGNYTDWRLPNIKELTSLVNYSKSNPASDFPDMPSPSFWSSSSLFGAPDLVWLVNFNYGEFTTNNKYLVSYVRCVRGGP